MKNYITIRDSTLREGIEVSKIKLSFKHKLTKTLALYKR